MRYYLLTKICIIHFVSNIFVLQKIQYEPYKALEQPFEFIMENGLVKALSVSQNLTNQEENLIKGILSSIQFDRSDKNVIGKYNSLLEEERVNAAYNKMEIDVTGNCEVSYFY